MLLEEAVETIQDWVENCRYALQNLYSEEDRVELRGKEEAYLSVLSLLKEVHLSKSNVGLQ